MYKSMCGASSVLISLRYIPGTGIAGQVVTPCLIFEENSGYTVYIPSSNCVRAVFLHILITCHCLLFVFSCPWGIMFFGLPADDW